MDCVEQLLLPLLTPVHGFMKSQGAVGGVISSVSAERTLEELTKLEAAFSPVVICVGTMPMSVASL